MNVQAMGRADVPKFILQGYDTKAKSHWKMILTCSNGSSQ